MKRTMRTSTTFTSSSVKVSQIKEFLKGLPDYATITVTTYTGDYREPGSSSTYSASWIVDDED